MISSADVFYHLSSTHWPPRSVGLPWLAQGSIALFAVPQCILPPEVMHLINTFWVIWLVGCDLHKLPEPVCQLFGLWWWAKLAVFLSFLPFSSLSAFKSFLWQFVFYYISKRCKQKHNSLIPVHMEVTLQLYFLSPYFFLSQWWCAYISIHACKNVFSRSQRGREVYKGISWFTQKPIRLKGDERSVWRSHLCTSTAGSEGNPPKYLVI